MAAPNAPEPAPPARRADARRNRDHVLQAAREAFAEAGWDVPLDVIAARAGVGPGTVYRHFRTKDALFQAVIVDRLTQLIADAGEAARAADPGASFFAFLDRMVAEAAAKHDTPEALTVPGELQRELHRALTTLLTRAQAAGAVKPAITTEDLLTLLKSLFTVVRQAGDADQLARLVAVLADGLRPA